MGTLEDILSSAYLAHSCAPAFKAAWQVVHAFAVTRADGDALLRHLATSGTLADALQSPLWAIEADNVRPVPVFLQLCVAHASALHACSAAWIRLHACACRSSDRV